jgi:hypothetical protein
VFTILAWTSASTATFAWNPPPPAVGDGLCSRACEADACLRFVEADADADTQRRCVSEAALRLGDLRRAGPDQACIQRCIQHGSPVELTLLDGVEPSSLGQR